jgi:uncharacterized protein (TIGR04255 family)
MGKYPTLKKAPIVEALVDIQTTFPSALDMSVFENFYRQVADAYPNREQQGFIEVAIATTSQGVPQALNPKTTLAGLRLSSVDKKHIIQVGGRGFTFSQLAPYRDGDEFRDLAHDLWTVFANLTPSVQVNRLALRCINRIELPLPLHDFDDYFKTFIRLPEGIPQGLAELLMRFVLPHPNLSNAGALVTIQVESIQPEVTYIPVLFDIDVFQMVSFQPDSKEIWENIELLREFRNQIFFESLTEKTLRLYQ